MQADEWQCKALHLASPVVQSKAQQMYEMVLHGTQWHQDAGKPHSTAWMVRPPCTCSCNQGRFLAGATPFPAWMTEMMAGIMPHVGLPEPEEWPTCCDLLLCPSGRPHEGWRADREDAFRGLHRAISTVTLVLGESCRFQIRGMWPGATTASAVLQDGNIADHGRASAAPLRASGPHARRIDAIHLLNVALDHRARAEVRSWGRPAASCASRAAGSWPTFPRMPQERATRVRAARSGWKWPNAVCGIVQRVLLGLYEAVLGADGCYGRDGPGGQAHRERDCASFSVGS